MKRTSIKVNSGVAAKLLFTVLLITVTLFSSCSKDNGELHPTHQLLLGDWDRYQVINNTSGEVDTYDLDGVLDVQYRETEVCTNVGCDNYTFESSNNTLQLDDTFQSILNIDVLTDTDLEITNLDNNKTGFYKRIND